MSKNAAVGATDGRPNAEGISLALRCASETCQLLAAIQALIAADRSDETYLAIRGIAIRAEQVCEAVFTALESDLTPEQWHESRASAAAILYGVLPARRMEEAANG